MTHDPMSDEGSYQETMASFPVGKLLSFNEKPLWVMGYAPPDSLICSSIDPCENYHAAVQSCWSYCASAFRVKH